MKVFNVGALEFVFILLIAFIVLGPEKAIKAAGDLARWIRGLTRSQFWQDLVSTSKEIQDIPKKLMEDAEIQNTIADLDRSTGEIRKIFRETGMGIDQELNSDMGEKSAMESSDNKESDAV
jgi:Sec-independent protein translocase protein TatA